MSSGIRRVLAPLDLGEGSRRVQDHAIKLAGSAGAALTLVHVRTVPGAPVDWSAVPDPEKRWLSWVGMDTTLIASFEQEVVESEEGVEAGLVRAIVHHLPNLLVLRTQGRKGLRKMLSGSIAETLSRRLGAITLFLPDEARGVVDPDTGHTLVERVMVPIAPDREQAQLIVDVASTMLEVLGALRPTVQMVHCGSERTFPDLALPRTDDAIWRKRCSQGPLLSVLLEEAQVFNPDLIVMATSGHQSLWDVFGSTAEQVIRRSRCPVVTVPLGQEA